MSRTHDRKVDFSTFHIINFFDEHGISYRTSGKNIGAGWIGLESCPFCTAGGFHFGVHARNKTGSCWICGESCGCLTLVKVLLDCDKREAWSEIKRFNSDDLSWIPDQDYTGDSVIFPDGMVKGLTKGAWDYLKGRNYPVKELQQQFKLRSTEYGATLYVDDREWDFSNRVIVPVYMNRRLQCYLGRDYTDNHDPKYMNSPVVASITAPHHCIYNYDTLTGKIIILEGVTDVWRMGAKTGAFLGITYTAAQVRLLAQKRVTEANVLFDKGAEKRAKLLATALTGVIDKVRVAYLDDGDPGELTHDEAMKIKYQLIGEI